MDVFIIIKKWGEIMIELCDLYNENREKTGVLHQRGEPMKNGYYYLVVSVWIMNNKGQYLMSQRHPDKNYPEYWECTGGFVLAGETSLQGAIREVKEELGLSLEAVNGRVIYSSRREESQDFYDAWMFHADVSISDLTLQKSEVIDARWMKRKDIDDLYLTGKLHPLLFYYRDVL